MGVLKNRQMSGKNIYIYIYTVSFVSHVQKSENDGNPLELGGTLFSDETWHSHPAEAKLLLLLLRQLSCLRAIRDLRCHQQWGILYQLGIS